MPVLKEAAVILTGTVVSVEAKKKYVNNAPTNEDDGLKVIIDAGGGDGYAAVSLGLLDAAHTTPMPGELVSWVVRYGAWSRNDNAQSSTRFVRKATPSDLDRVLSVAGSASK